MKTHKLLFIVLTLGILLTLSTLVQGCTRENSTHPPQPTLAPTPDETEIARGSEPGPTPIPLTKPLETPEEALQQLTVHDANWAEWEEPWTVDTLTAAPDRIIIEGFPSRTEESQAMGFDEGFDPASEDAAGAVWSIIIKGNVRLNLIGSGIDGPVEVDGVNYVISARTGNLLTIRGGIPEKYREGN